MGQRTFQGAWKPGDPSKPLLYISLGTAYSDQPSFYRMCIETFGNSRWHVVMSVGRMVNITPLEDIPSNMEVYVQVPQLDVLAHAHAFVTHGGMNSTMESLAHGVPLIVIPQAADQRAVAKRVEMLALGERISREAVTGDALRAAVERVAGSENIRQNITAMRQAIQVAGGVAKAVEVIEQML